MPLTCTTEALIDILEIWLTSIYRGELSFDLETLVGASQRGETVRSIQSLVFIRLFSIIIIFFAVVAGFTYFVTAEAIKQFALSDAATSLTFIVNNIEGNYKSELLAIDQIADMNGFIPFDEDTARDIIKEFLELPNIFTTVHMYKADGTLVFAERRKSFSASPYHPKSNFNQKDAAFVKLAHKVIEDKHPYSSEAFFTWSGALYQTYVTPIFKSREKKEVMGVLSGGVFPRLKKIEYLLQGLKLGNENFILITDSRGNFITGDGISEKEAGSVLKKHTEGALNRFFLDVEETSKKPFVTQRQKVADASFVVMSLPIPELKLLVTLGFNTQPIDQKTHELSNRLYFALIIGFLLSVFASVVVGERLSRPFREIAQTVDEINLGNFSARTGYKGEDEIGLLSERINMLAEKIEKSEYLGNLWYTEAEHVDESDLSKPNSPPVQRPDATHAHSQESEKTSPTSASSESDQV